MKRFNNIKLKTLKQTQAFYIWELKREESLTESERSKYLLALKSIEKIIKERERSGERGKHKKFIAYDHRKAVFLNKRGY
ncbi:hypothetical protein ES695_03480 [Candidatus Atribacteria bacterium 1244-E10-H5-B2]|jgi:hypothetical protein|nr:MAG: hypothetical protein ES695_03480 [Candidatus Atribacteria bacterium 1244-E10-H5-B2]